MAGTAAGLAMPCHGGCLFLTRIPASWAACHPGLPKAKDGNRGGGAAEMHHALLEDSGRLLPDGSSPCRSMFFPATRGRAATCIEMLNHQHADEISSPWRPVSIACGGCLFLTRIPASWGGLSIPGAAEGQRWQPRWRRSRIASCSPRRHRPAVCSCRQ